MQSYRSVLFAPGIDTRKMEKALGLGADVVILDLEDSVEAGRKAAARELVASMFEQPTEKPVLWVRVNPPDTDFFAADMLAVVPCRPAGIMLPKAETAEGVARVGWLLNLLEVQHGLARGGIDLVPLVESARGVKNAAAIAAVPGVKRMCFGAVDYTLDMGIELTKDGTELFYARSAMVVASRSAGIENPIDTPYTNVKDAEGMAAECRLARTLGFQGKLLIHPGQVAPANEIFAPTADEITRARRIVEAYEAALAAGTGVAQLNGKLIEKPVAERARRLLQTAGALGLVQ